MYALKRYKTYPLHLFQDGKNKTRVLNYYKPRELSRESEDEKKLWAAVIATIIEDAFLDCLEHYPRKIKKITYDQRDYSSRYEARRLILYDPEEDFAFLCTLAGFDKGFPCTIKRMLKQKIKPVVPSKGRLNSTFVLKFLVVHHMLAGVQVQTSLAQPFAQPMICL